MLPGRPRKKQAPPGSFGDTLFKLRQSRGLSVQVLAGKIRVTPHHIRKLEEGESIPSAGVMSRLASALGVLPIALKLACGQLEFWDLYPIDPEQPPSGYSLSNISEEEEVKLLWFLQYIRSAGV